MIKMIIADDEPVIVRGLQRLVDWERFGIDIVGTYEDGKETLNGIIRKKPHIALLDIQMPGMTGVEILMAVKKLGFRTNIIFISGFQDFSYAKAALQHGATDYILKPVVKEELLNALEKVIPREKLSEVNKSSNDRNPDYAKLSEKDDNFYLTVYVHIVFRGDESDQVVRLLDFSIISFFEEYMEEHQKGIMFTKEEYIILVFQGMDRDTAVQELAVIGTEIKARFDYDSVFVMGDIISTMSEIPVQYEKCISKKRYLFFADQLRSAVIYSERPVFSRKIENNELLNCKIRIIQDIILQNRDSFSKTWMQLTNLVCLAADGEKEDACYHFCTLIKDLEDKLCEMGITSSVLEEKNMLEEGRNCKSYSRLLEVYHKYFVHFQEVVKTSIAQSGKSDINKAKTYIEEHYMDNLNMEVLAEVMYMNSYYFSSYFKKNAGENFKDYLTKVRLKHALPLVISTRMSSSDIAVQTGFSDARAFNKAFYKMYGETPSAYRKRNI